jgi:hypothetical protein
MFAELRLVTSCKATELPNAPTSEYSGDRRLVGIGNDQVASNFVKLPQEQIFARSDLVVLIERGA